MSQLKTNSITNISNTGDPNIVLGDSGDVQVQSLNSGPLGGFRNQLINGNFQFWQRDTSFTAAGYSSDRWYLSGTAGTFSRGVNAALGQVYSASFSATQDGHIQQGVELPLTGAPGPFMSGSEWTFSVYIKTTDNPVGKDVDIFFRDSVASETNAVRATAAAPTLIATGDPDSNGFTRYSTTFTITAAPSGTNTCLTVKLLGGTSYGVSVDYSAAQLEPGPVATPFEDRPIGTELALCQRYYYQTNDIIYGFRRDSSNGIAISHYFPQTMRAAPTFVGSDSSSNTAGGTNAITQSSFRRTITSPTNPAVPVSYSNAKFDAEL